MMPPGGAAARAEAIGTVSTLAQERFVDADIGRLLEELRGLEESSDYDSVEASLIRVTRRDWEKATRVPPELVGDLNGASAVALSAWGPAKEESDFEALRPYLETNLELRQRYIECFDPADETYDVLLDNYEPNMKTADVRQIFDTAEGGARAADPGDRRCRRRRRLLPPAGLRPGCAAGVQPRGVAPLRLHGRRMADRPDTASVHDQPRTRGHPAHDEFPPGRPELALRDDARVRARRLRVGRRPSRSRGRRSARASRSVCTSPRAGRGRTSSAGAARSGASSTRACRRHSRASSARSTRRRSIARSTGCTRP